MSLRFKRHYKLLLLLVLASALFIAGAGDERIVAYSVPGGEQAVEQALAASTAVTVLWEAATVGSDVQIREAGYDGQDAGSQ